MVQELTLFDQPNLVIPAHMRGYMDKLADIPDKNSVPTLSYRGRKWTTIVGGEAKLLSRRNPEGFEETVSLLKLVILSAAPRRGRTFYVGEWDKASPKAPDCWSADGVKPSDNLQFPVALACDNCPKAVKGSKINALGKPTTACQQHRLIAVVPAGNLDHTPMRFKFSVTSDFDGMSPDLERVGWFAFRNYQDFLRSRGIPSASLVVTRVMFDPNVDYAKVVFNAESLITDPATLDRIVKLRESPEVTALVTENWEPPPALGGDVDADAPGPGPGPAPAAAAQPSVDEAFITPEMEQQAKQPARQRQQRARAPAQDKVLELKPEPAKPTLMDEPDPFAAVPSAQVANANAKPQEDEILPDDVASILSDWS